MKKLIVLAVLLATAVPASASTVSLPAPMDWWPIWSPDGSHATFTRVSTNHMELYSLDLRTRRAVRVGSNAGQLDPTWSNDGTHLAYSSGGVLWIVSADGTGKRRYAAPTRAFAPAWQPATTNLAYLTTHGAQNTDLWVAGKLWAKNAIGTPAWSPDGKRLAFQREDGIYVTDGTTESVAQRVANPGPAAWSHDGARVAFAVGHELRVAAADGSAVRRLASNLHNPGTPSWSFDDKWVALSHTGGVWVANVGGGGYPADPGERAYGVGASFAPRADDLLISASVPACPGHLGIREVTRATVRTLTGSCQIVGTSKGDFMEGTPLWGDVIKGLAGNDQIHANDGHTDTVNCGPGRDTVWADRTDKLTACEIVHR